MPTLEQIKTLPEGATWLRADLHIHTSASRDISPKWAASTSQDVVRIALEKGLDIIAVTDHNTAQNCDSIGKAATGTSLTVFPGVEISTPQGHLLAVFDNGTPATKIEDLLIKVGISREQFGSLDIAAKVSIREACEIIESEGAIAVAAHVETERGFLNTIKVAAERKRAYETPGLRCLEITDLSQRDKYQKGLASGYNRRLACIQSSDCLRPGSPQHELDAMASRYTLLKMSSRSVSGLKMAFIDPEMRVKLSNDANPVPKDVIVGMWVTGGFLNGQQFRYSDNVTSLIGDTGSGKSVSLELIRFGLNQRASVPKIVQEVDSLVSQQLRNLGTVHIILRKDTTYYLVERTWGTPPTSPSVSRLTNGTVEPINEEIDMRLFFPIKAFSQSEIIEFAREPTVRLSLTDDLIDSSSEASTIKDLKLKLEENASNTRIQIEKKAKILKELSDLPTLIESRSLIDTLLSDPRIQQHQLWYKEKGFIEQSLASFVMLEQRVTTCLSALQVDAPNVDNIDALPNADLFEELLAMHTQWSAATASTQAVLTNSAKDILDKVNGLKGRWDTKFAKAEAEYQKLIADIDKEGKGLQALSERRRKVEEQIVSLQTLERELNATVNPQLSTLQTERELLLTQLQDNRRAITTKREAKTKELSTKLDNKIRLEVRAQANRSLFRTKLQEISPGSRVAGDDLTTIAEKCHPVAFVKRLLAEDYDFLATQSGIDKAKFVRYRENALARGRLDELYSLQLTDVEDIIEVMLDVGKTEYKPIESLAHGQKCMVVLMVALAEGQSPLLVDQPEDALHAPGIEEGIVSTLRSRRGVRQCIFATRNANIIVSADAEQILPLEADAHNGKLVGCGCLDNFDQKMLVIYHVEGGEEAFRRRQTKYSLRPS